jgi:hypothetical protein
MYCVMGDAISMGVTAPMSAWKMTNVTREKHDGTQSFMRNQ